MDTECVPHGGTAFKRPMSPNEKTLMRKIELLLQTVRLLDADRARLIAENRRLSRSDTASA
jgi:hypothetical protein